MITVNTFPVGELQSNCHIVVNSQDNSTVLVDCGGNPVSILKYLNDNGLNLKAILLTHGHYDHFEGASIVQAKTNCKVYISKLDSSMLTDKDTSLAKALGYYDFQPVSEFTTVTDGDTIKEANLEFKVLSTPGHTMGSVCYICQDCLFTGDTLFKHSMGRTDFPNGNYFDMQKSLDRLYNLKGDYRVYTGHNQNSTLNEERKNNPYLLDAIRNVDEFF